MKLRLHLYKTSVPHTQASERQVEFYNEQYIPLLNVDVDVHVLWRCAMYCLHLYIFLFLSLAKSGMSHAHSSMSVSALHLYYICPEGATVKLVCAQGGGALHKTDVLRKAWLFTPHSDQHCKKQHPRHTNTGHSHVNHSWPPGLHIGASEHNFWVVLQNVTYADQGRYCCMVLDIKDHSVVQAPHSHVVLTVTPRKDTILMWTYSKLVYGKLEVEQVK